MTLCRSRWDRDRHGDWLVELPPPGLHSDDGAEGGSVAEDRPRHVIWHRLGLDRSTGGQRKDDRREFMVISRAVWSRVSCNICRL